MYHEMLHLELMELDIYNSAVNWYDEFGNLLVVTLNCNEESKYCVLT